jgi:hypothetical protein
MNSKQQYLEMRATWKSDYAVLSAQIREAKSLYRWSGSNYEAATRDYYAFKGDTTAKNFLWKEWRDSLKNLNDNRHKFLRLKQQANSLLAILIAMKEDSAKRRLESKLIVELAG